MTMLTKWLNNPYVLGALLVTGTTWDLILVGWAYDLSKSDWGTWVGSIGTVATLAGTIWLATSERRQRRRNELDLALVVAAGLTFQIPFIKNLLTGIIMIMDVDSVENRATDYKKILAFLDQAPLWNANDLTPLVGINGHLAARLAFASAQVKGIRSGIEMAAKEPLYTHIFASVQFNKMTLPQLRSPIEVLEDCLARCRKFMDQTGFSDESPEDEIA